MTIHNDDTDTKATSKKRKIVIVIAILSIIIIIQGIKIYTDHQTKKSQKEVLTNTNNELTSTIKRLHEIRTELNQSITEVERLGGNVAELKRAKAEIEADLLNTRRRTGQNIKQLREKVAGYEHLLKAKDKELAKLKIINKELHSENKDLKTTQNTLSDSIVQLAKNTESLASKVVIASRLKANNIAVFAVNTRGKERKSPFRKAHIAKLKITFNIAENKVAPIEGKKVFIRIIDPSNQIIFDMDSGSGTFMLDGREEFYTSSQDILFDNTLQQMAFFYQKDSKYVSGLYRVEVFTEDYLMGKFTFLVK